MPRSVYGQDGRVSKLRRPMDPVSRAQNSTPQRVGRPFEKGNAYTFRKGQSGNPGGRPKHSISGIYRKWLNKAKNRKKIEQMLDETIQGKSKMAGVLLIREMTERDEGKVVQAVEMEVSGRITLEQVLEAKKKAGK